MWLVFVLLKNISLATEVSIMVGGKWALPRGKTQLDVKPCVSRLESCWSDQFAHRWSCLVSSNLRILCWIHRVHGLCVILWLTNFIPYPDQMILVMIKARRKGKLWRGGRLDHEGEVSGVSEIHQICQKVFIHSFVWLIFGTALEYLNNDSKYYGVSIWIWSQMFLACCHL